MTSPLPKMHASNTHHFAPFEHHGSCSLMRSHIRSGSSPLHGEPRTLTLLSWSTRRCKLGKLSLGVAPSEVHLLAPRMRFEHRPDKSLWLWHLAAFVLRPADADCSPRQRRLAPRRPLRALAVRHLNHLACAPDVLLPEATFVGGTRHLVAPAHPDPLTHQRVEQRRLGRLHIGDCINLACSFEPLPLPLRRCQQLFVRELCSCAAHHSVQLFHLRTAHLSP
mmetsp:Transcript_56348/g.125750  ORF Transcript_56348/g.125750 Transcript_56348/m.125750 type:complete len:222 (-) Transcript_56348:839-1504(-)